MSSKFDIAIITHRADALLQQCIESVLCQSAQPENILVIATGTQAPPENKLLTIIISPGCSYAEAVNQAFAHSTLDLLLLNDDTKLTTGCLRELLLHSAPDRLLQPQIALLEQPDIIENCGHWIGCDASNTARHRGQPLLSSEPETIPCFSGAAVWIPFSVRQKIGDFDPSLSPFGEDVDYAIRCRRAGLEIHCVYNAVVEHKLGHSYGLSSTQKIAWVEEHRIRILWRHFPLSSVLSLHWTLKRYHWMSQGKTRFPELRRREAAIGITLGWLRAARHFPIELRKRDQLSSCFLQTETGFLKDVARGVHRTEVQHPAIKMGAV